MPLRPEDVTVAELFKQAGYATGIVGKWGIGEPGTTGIPNKKGFDDWFGYLNQVKAHNYYPPFLWRNQEKVYFPQHAGFDHRKQSQYDQKGKVLPHGIKDPEKAIYSFDRYCEESLKFVRRHRNRPFFLYLPYTPPHGKLIVPDLGPYREKDWAIGHQEWAAMITRLHRTEDAVLATKTLLSDLTDLDYTEAVTRFQQAQTALQANLLTGSRMLQISLMDFLQ